MAASSPAYAGCRFAHHPLTARSFGIVFFQLRRVPIYFRLYIRLGRSCQPSSLPHDAAKGRGRVRRALYDRPPLTRHCLRAASVEAHGASSRLRDMKGPAVLLSAPTTRQRFRSRPRAGIPSHRHRSRRSGRRTPRNNPAIRGRPQRPREPGASRTFPRRSPKQCVSSHSRTEHHRRAVCRNARAVFRKTLCPQCRYRIPGCPARRGCPRGRSPESGVCKSGGAEYAAIGLHSISRKTPRKHTLTDDPAASR